MSKLLVNPGAAQKENLKKCKAAIKSLGWDDFRIQKFLTSPNLKFGGCKPVDLIRNQPEQFVPAILMACQRKILDQFEATVSEYEKKTAAQNNQMGKDPKIIMPPDWQPAFVLTPPDKGPA